MGLTLPNFMRIRELLLSEILLLPPFFYFKSWFIHLKIVKSADL